MSIPIEALVRPISSDDLFNLLLDSLEAIQIPARSWRSGSVARSILGVLAQAGAQGSTIVADCVAAGFLAYAHDIGLSAHAEDFYGVERIDATFATGKVTLTNGGGGIYTVAANELVVSSSNTSARFRVTDSFVLGANSAIDVNVMAIESGSDSSVAPAEIDQLETTLNKVTVFNATSLVGTDAETDDALRLRCLAKRGTWSPFGPRDAYVFAATSATLTGGLPTSITRVSVSRFSSIGKVIVVCATPTGAPSSDELAAVTAACNAMARPDTVTLEVDGASPVAVNKSITVWARGGSTTLLALEVQRGLTQLLSAYPIGGIAKSDGGQGYLYTDAIAAAVIDSDPQIFDVDISDETDIPLATNQVPTNSISLTVRILSP